MLFKMSRLAFYCGAGLLCLVSGNVFAGQTTQVNVASNGAQPNSVGYNLNAQMNADGRYVTFTSTASNLVAGDNNNAEDVFVHDRQTHQTERVSVALNGGEANKRSTYSSISADGRYVAFLSSASNLVAKDKNNAVDVFVFDRLMKKTTRVSVSSTGTETSGIAEPSYLRGVSLSADGQFVAFSGLVNVDGDSALCSFCAGTFIHNRLTHKTKRISSGDNENINANSMSADGRYVAFASTAKKDEWDNNTVFVYDNLTDKTEPVSVDSGGKTVGYISWNGYSLSANGRYVAFSTSAPNRMLDDTSNKSETVFVYDRHTHKTEQISTSSGEFIGYSAAPSLSADGRFVAFGSNSPHLVKGDTNQSTDVFVHDRATHKTELASVDSNDVQAKFSFFPSPSYSTSLSADGRHVVFASVADNLINELSSGSIDIFARDRLLDTHHHADLKITQAKGDYLFRITNNGPNAVNDVTVLQLTNSQHPSIKPLDGQGKCSTAAQEIVCHLGKLGVGKTRFIVTSLGSKQLFVNAAPIDTVPANNQISIPKR
jgi:hypothetical protein